MLCYGATLTIIMWERDQTASVPVMRISGDDGRTFGPTLNIGTNGTIGSTRRKRVYLCNDV
ncbi:MAG: hypothetical protein ACJ72Q_19135 [Nitrososphaeraceae archaeon]|jgi:hypothetical protein